MIRPRTGIAAVALAAAAIGGAPAFADGKNEIRAVTFDEDGETTRVRVRGAQTPTFTMYKLERPTRVVVDVPQARLAEALRGPESSLVTTAGTWAVSTIAAQQIDDGGSFVRVIISLARPGRYDVKTDGNTLVVLVTARDPAPRRASPAALAAAEAAKQAAVREAAAAKADAEAARTEVARAKDDAARTRADAEAARRAAAADKQQADADRRTAETARAEADRMLREAKVQIAALDRKARAAQVLEDKARTARAAAEAREEAAREAAARAAGARTAAEATARAAAERAAEAAARSSTQVAADRAQVAADRARLAAEARAAEARLSAARRATEETEARRAAAEAAAQTARKDLDRTRTALAAVEQQRSTAETAATQAVQRRGEAEQAARSAAQRRGEAELQRLAAEAQRKAAEQAARDAAAREETRRAELARQRAEEEQALARLAATRAALPPASLVAQAPMKPAAPAPIAAQALMKPPAPAPVAAQAPMKPAAPKPAAPKPAPAAPAKISDIRFQGGADRGEVAIAIAGDAAVSLGSASATRVELVVDRAELAAALERKLDVSRFGSPVRAVSSFRDRRVPNRVRLIAELARPVTPTFERDGGVLRWRFAAAAAAPTTVAKRAPAPAAARNLPGGGRPQAVPTPVVGGFGATSTPVAQQSVAQVPPQPGRRRIYRGATINLEVKDAPLHDLMRLIGDTGRVSIVIPDTITPKVTVRLQRVPWDQALEVVLASHGLWYRREGNIYRIATRKELDAEDEAEAARREAAIKSEVPRPEIVPLNYASAADLKPKLEGMLSGRPGSKIEVDERSNALIINDVAGNRDQIAKLALSLDTQTPQISIEARVVEARSTFLRQIGVQWGGNAGVGANGGNATGLIWPSTIGIRGGNEDAQTVRNGVASPSDFAVNLPAATGSGEGGAIGLSLGSIGGNFNINLRISALEDSGTARIISAPKITVLNNKPAKISSGVSIPISVISAAGTQTQFVQADLSLEVTPYVSQRDCAIAMNLKVTKNEPDFVNVGARGDPSILRKEASTSMLVNDGETTVLGGIYTRNSGLAYKKVPFFGDLPVLGWLFKNRRENDDRTELLVFITPKITNRALLRCQ